MQQRGDRFRLVRAVFHRDCSDPEDMRDVGDPGLLPELSAVNSRSVNQRFFKLRRELHIRYSLGRTIATVSVVATSRGLFCVTLAATFPAAPKLSEDVQLLSILTRQSVNRLPFCRSQFELRGSDVLFQVPKR